MRCFLFALAVFILTGCESAGRFALPTRPKSEAAATLEVVSVDPHPILDRGLTGDFDAVDVLNPSIVIDRPDTLLNFYSGFDGKTWHTGLAKFSNGAWTKMGRILSPSGWEGDYIAANG